MNPLTQDIALARAYLERMRPLLNDESDAIAVQNAAIAIAESLFDGGMLATKARALPVPPVVGPPFRKPLAQRTPEFDAAVTELERAFHSGVDDIENYQRRVDANAATSRKDVRTSVLAFFAQKPVDVQWGHDALWFLGLSEAQIIDALEYWEQQGAIKDGGHQKYLGGEWVWMVRLTPDGRDFADGSLQIAAGLQTVIFNTFHNSNVANAGVAEGDVTQNITLFPDLPTDVRAKLLESAHGTVLVEGLDEERALAQPRKDKIRKLAQGVKSAMEGANTITEFSNHLSEWFAHIAEWLGDAGGL